MGEQRDTGRAAGARVVVYTRPGCHLCEIALATVAEVCAARGVAWTEVDITPDEALTTRYGEEVPVTLVDGRQHDFWRVDAQRLTAALDSGPPRG